MKAPDRASRTSTWTSKVLIMARQSIPRFSELWLSLDGTDASHERSHRVIGRSGNSDVNCLTSPENVMHRPDMAENRVCEGACAYFATAYTLHCKAMGR